MFKLLVLGALLATCMGGSLNRQKRESGTFSAWTDYGPCSGMCNQGHQQRSRTCTSTDGQCTGDLVETQDCVCAGEVDERACAEEVARKPGDYYLGDPCDCAKYYQCEPIGGDQFRIHHHNCSACTNFDEASSVCGIHVFDCDTSPTTDTCTDWNGIVEKKMGADDKRYLWKVNGLWISMPCALGTIFSLDDCNCIHDPSYAAAASNSKSLLSCFDFTDSVIGTKGMYASSVGTSIGGAAHFGGNGQVAISYFNNGNRYGAFSVSLWFKRTGTGNGQEGLLYNGCGTNGYSIAIISTTQDEISASIKTDNGEVTITGVTATYNTWNHVAVVYSGVSLKVYVDGAIHSSTAAITGLIENRQCPMLIGSAGPGLGFTGNMDKVCFYDTALSATDVTAAVTDGHDEWVDPPTST